MRRGPVRRWRVHANAGQRLGTGWQRSRLGRAKAKYLVATLVSFDSSRVSGLPLMHHGDVVGVWEFEKSARAAQAYTLRHSGEYVQLPTGRREQGEEEGWSMSREQGGSRTHSLYKWRNYIYDKLLHTVRAQLFPDRMFYIVGMRGKLERCSYNRGDNNKRQKVLRAMRAPHGISTSAWNLGAYVQETRGSVYFGLYNPAQDRLRQ